MIWAAVLAASLGCAALKLAGWSLPRRWLEGERVQRAAALLPIALLAALVAVQTLADGTRVVVDARVAGVGVAALMLAARAPFLLVLAAAAGTAALLRAL
jgi:hypothetical protein